MQIEKKEMHLTVGYIAVFSDTERYSEDIYIKIIIKNNNQTIS